MASAREREREHESARDSRDTPLDLRGALVSAMAAAASMVAQRGGIPLAAVLAEVDSGVVAMMVRHAVEQSAPSEAD